MRINVLIYVTSFFFEHYYMNVCAKFTADKTDDVTSDLPDG